MRYVFLALFFLLSSSGAPAAEPSAAVVRAAQDFSNVAERANPWVVNIATTQTEVVQQYYPSLFFDFFGAYPGGNREYKRQSLGSGLILTADGQILTNAHVVAGAEQIDVRLHNGEEYKAEVLGEDENVDLAVLKIRPKNPLQAAALGNSDKVRVGEWAIALGNPFGYDHSVTVGVISAKNRSNVLTDTDQAKYQNFLQTDASINSGNSGGPLCNISGEVIGINAAIITPNKGSIGIGFAIPINMVKRAVPDLVKLGRVVPPRLGFYTQNLDERLASALGLESTRGVLVADVRAGLPADKSGLKRGDVIISVAGKPVASETELKARLYEIGAGEAVVMTVMRKGKPLGLRMVGEQQTESSLDTWHGIKAVENTQAEARQRGLFYSGGVVVTGVAANSSAERIGLKPNDILVEINQERIGSLKEYRSLCRKFSETQDAVLLLVRGSSQAYIVLPAEGRTES